MARHPLISQAKSEALVRYGPEKSALKNVLRDALTTYQTASATADQAANAIKRAAKLARPEVAHIYDQADQSRKDAQHEADLTLGALAQDASTPLGFALQRERAAQATHSSTERASTLSDLAQRGVSAEQGRAYAKTNALATFNASKQQVGQRAVDLAREEGAFTQGRVGQLSKESKDRALKRSQQRETARHNRRSEANTQANTDLQTRKYLTDLTGKDPVTGKKKASTTKPMTHSEIVQVHKDTQKTESLVGKARAVIKMLRGSKADEQTIKDLLSRGGSVPYNDTYNVVKTYKDKTAPGGVKKVQTQAIRRKDIKVPAFDDAIIKAAYDLENFNYLTKDSVHNLRVNYNSHVRKEWLPPTSGQYGRH